MAWDEELIVLLDKYTPVNLFERYKNRQIADKELLYLGLGISPEKLQALVYAFNDIIDKYRNRPRLGHSYITVSQLGLCHTFGELFTLFKNTVDK